MRNITKPAAFFAIALAAFAASAGAQDYGSRGNLEASATDAERAEIEALYQRFIPYIDRARTELTMVKETVAYAEARGFREWDPALRGVSPSDRFYAINRDRTMLLWVVGSEPLASRLSSRADEVRGREISRI